MFRFVSFQVTSLMVTNRKTYFSLSSIIKIWLVTKINWQISNVFANDVVTSKFCTFVFIKKHLDNDKKVYYLITFKLEFFEFNKYHNPSSFCCLKMLWSDQWCRNILFVCEKLLSMEWNFTKNYLLNKDFCKCTKISKKYKSKILCEN